MKAVVQDLAPFEQMVNTLGSIAQHFKARLRAPSEGMYYELMHGYYSRALHAQEEGRTLVAYSVQIPTELLYAMDLVPIFLEGSSVTMAVALKNYDQFFSTAKGLGYAPEICSVHRCILSAYLSGWVPRPDVLLWSNQTCDNNVKSVDPVVELHNIPRFYVDAPYYFGERDVAYFARELEDMAAFLEGATGRRLDRDRFLEALHLSQQAVALHQETYRMRAAVPSPLSNRKPQQMVSIMRNFLGSPVAVDYLSQVLAEVKELVAQGKGAAPTERFRVVSLFAPPNHNWKLLDWMEREHGVVIVADPHNSHWGDFQWDFSQPFITVARRLLHHPTSYQMCGPLSKGLVRTAVEDAREHGAQGGIWWAHVGCRQACAIIRTVKDALKEGLGIPVAVVDIDTVDPTFVSDEEVKEKLEAFFEVLGEGG